MSKIKTILSTSEEFNWENLIPMKEETFSYDPTIHSVPKHALLGITDKCNLACDYCFQHTRKLKDMSLDTARQSIVWMLGNHKLRNSQDKLEISFFGGEPLLRFNEIIKPIVEEFSNKVKFNITTNGVLLKKDVVDYLYDNKIGLLLSFDGVKEVQNKQRPGKGFDSFEIISKNIPYLLTKYPNITFRMTLTSAAIPYLFKTFQLIQAWGAKSFVFIPNEFENWNLKDGKLLKQELVKIERNKKDIHISIIDKALDKLDKVINNIAKADNGVMRCGMGTQGCAITPDGDIVPCQEKVTNPTWVIGDVWNGINIKKHEDYLNWYFDSTKKLIFPYKISNEDIAFISQSICPSRLEDIDFKLRTSTIIFNQTIKELCYEIKALQVLEILDKEENNG